MRIFAKTDTGKVRSINQDAYAATVLPDGAAFAVVCDGMGGASAGDIASKTSVDLISHYILNAYTPSMDIEAIIKLMNNAINSANMHIYDLSQRDENLYGMGTTVVIAIVRQSQAILCNVGDSRAYLVSNDFVQLTRDHSVVQSLVESGKLSPEQAKNHPEKNVITRALGVEENIIIDSYTASIGEDDKLLLCTDGLSNYVADDEMFNTVKNSELDKVADVLIEKANNGGGRDNITAVVISH